MRIKPIGKRVLIEKITEKKEMTTVSGIILSTTQKPEKSFQGKVVALGSVRDIEDIEVGDIIIYGQDGEVEISSEKNLYIVNLEHIYAIKRG